MLLGRIAGKAHEAIKANCPDAYALALGMLVHRFTREDGLAPAFPAAPTQVMIILVQTKSLFRGANACDVRCLYRHPKARQACS